MTRGEVQDFLAMVQATYPNYNPPSRTAAVNAWTIALAEYSKSEIATAFKAYMQTSTSGFAPVPGQIIEKINLISRPQTLNEMEAWSLVSKAIRNSGYNSVEEFSKLPELIQRAVGLPEQLRVWALDERYDEQVVSSNFMRSYRTVIRRDEECSKLTDDVKLIIKRTNAASDVTRIEQQRNDTIKQCQIGQNEAKMVECKEMYTGVPERLKLRYGKLFDK